jgi:hypothetical protein
MSFAENLAERWCKTGAVCLLGHKRDLRRSTFDRR